MKPIKTLTLTALISLALLPHGAALHCNGDIITVGTGDAAVYIDDRSAQAGPINHWLYLESNGVEGLQSGDNPLLPCPEPECGETFPFWFYDPCRHTNPDTLIV